MLLARTVLHHTRMLLVSGKGNLLLITTYISELGVGIQNLIANHSSLSAIPDPSLSKVLLVQTRVRDCFLTFKRLMPGREGRRGRSQPFSLSIKKKKKDFLYSEKKMHLVF